MGTTLTDVLNIMLINGFRELPVVSGESLVGLVTERDLRGALGRGVGDGDMDHLDEVGLDKAVDRVMTRDVLAVLTETDVREALRLLLEHRFGSLPVVDEAFRPVGIFSGTDVLGWTLEHLELNPAAARA